MKTVILLVSIAGCLVLAALTPDNALVCATADGIAFGWKVYFVLLAIALAGCALLTYKVTSWTILSCLVVPAVLYLLTTGKILNLTSGC